MNDKLIYLNFDELVFENRHKEYGAYLLRKRYFRNLVIAISISLALFLLAVYAPGILKKFKKEEVIMATAKTVSVTLEAPPPLDESKEQLTPLEVPPVTLQEMIKFTTYEITKEAVEETEPIATQDELKESYAGEKTQEGVDFGDIRIDTSSRKVVEEVKEQEPFTFVEQMPAFPGGGQPMLMKYLRENIKYPDEAIENNIQGRVIVEFVVGPNGTIKNVKVIRGIGGGCDEEAVRVIKNMPPWNPGKQNGVAVPVKVVVPIAFTLNQN